MIGAPRPFGDRAFLIELDQRIAADTVARARALADAWEAQGLGEAVPAYASVLLTFDPSRTPRPRAFAAAATLDASATADASSGRAIEIPTTYDGPDLAETAARSGLAVPDLVALHAAREYTAFFIGFMPGFAYCGTLDPRIVAPRLASPRARVPAGAVAVADGQTAVYPFSSPGGWRLIGRTELRMFDPAAERPALVAPGDRVRFVSR